MGIGIAPSRERKVKKIKMHAESKYLVQAGLQFFNRPVALVGAGPRFWRCGVNFGGFFLVGDRGRPLTRVT